MVDKKGLLYPYISTKLTKAEQEVLDLLTIKFFTPKQVQIARNCSKQAVYKIIRNLKNKGVLDTGFNKVDKSEAVVNQNQVRLHGQEFNIKIIWQDQIYQKRILESNLLYLDSHAIKLFRNSIEIYAGGGTSFYGEDENRADKKALSYWNRFFIKLEQELHIIIIKDRCRNIKEVNHHFARGNSELCEKELEEQGKRIRVYCPIDGKLAFITDESFGNKEDETVHPLTAKRDRGNIDKQVNDWRLNNPPTNSEIWKITAQMALNQKKTGEMVDNLTQLQKELPGVLNRLETQINSHLKLIQEYRKENISWRKHTEEKYKKQNNNQRTLNEYGVERR